MDLYDMPPQVIAAALTESTTLVRHIEFTDDWTQRLRTADRCVDLIQWATYPTTSPVVPYAWP